MGDLHGCLLGEKNAEPLFFPKGSKNYAKPGWRQKRKPGLFGAMDEWG